MDAMEKKEGLWEADDQAARLIEMTSNDPELKDAPLRRDVRSLGRLLGEVLKQQGGKDLFDRVEHLRQLAIQHRELQGAPHHDSEANLRAQYELMNQAQLAIQGLSVSEAYELTKAFSIYFELTNLAETNHRKRRRRAAELSVNPQPQPGTLRGTLLRLRERKMTADEV